MTSTEHRTLQIVPGTRGEARATATDTSAATGVAALARAVRQETPLGESARALANRAGGLQALAGLGVEPLPDEPFDWAAVDDADRDVVAQVLALADPVCDARLGTEHRTIARRLLALVAARDPGPLRRSKRPARLAAGLVLAVLDGNGDLARGASLRAGDVAAWFATSGVGDVARALVRGAQLEIPYDLDRMWLWRMPTLLASPSLLHTEARRRLIDERDRLIQEIEEDERRRAGRRAVVHLDDGSVESRCTLADVFAVRKGVSPKGQTLVMVGVAPVQPQPELERFALTVDEAHRLLHLLDLALAGPAPGGWPAEDAWWGYDD